VRIADRILAGLRDHGFCRMTAVPFGAASTLAGAVVICEPWML
jgi:hypothetical protein